LVPVSLSFNMEHIIFTMAPSLCDGVLVAHMRLFLIKLPL
jgi:hypothetical protein